MIDAEDLAFGEARGDGIVDLAARGEIRTKRLFERETNVGRCKPDRGQAGNYRFEEIGGSRQEDRQGGLVVADRLGKLREAFLIIDVERDVIEPGEKAVRHFLVEEIVGQIFLERLAREGAETLGIEVRSRGTDDLEVGGKQSIRIESVERRQQHSPGKITGRAEHQESGRFFSHGLDVTSEARNGIEFRF